VIKLSRSELEKLLNDDVPYFDLTTHLAGIEDAPARLRYITRETTTLACVEEAYEMFGILGADAVLHVKSGQTLQKGECFLEASGGAQTLHSGWRAALSLLEHASGVATQTAKFVQKAKNANPKINVVTTRKNFPGLKKVSIKAVLCGGALPHRLGLSETVLFFDEHIAFMGGLHAFVKKLPEMKHAVPEKKIIVEAHNEADALLLAKSGADAVQLDKFAPEVLQELVKKLKGLNPNIIAIATGGINMGNVDIFANTGVDLIATSSLFFTKPADIKVELLPA
jgi:molybdenum transport protein